MHCVGLAVCGVCRAFIYDQGVLQPHGQTNSCSAVRVLAMMMEPVTRVARSNVASYTAGATGTAIPGFQISPYTQTYQQLGPVTLQGVPPGSRRVQGPCVSAWGRPSAHSAVSSSAVAPLPTMTASLGRPQMELAVSSAAAVPPIQFVPTGSCCGAQPAASSQRQSLPRTSPCSPVLAGTPVTAAQSSLLGMPFAGPSSTAFPMPEPEADAAQPGIPHDVNESGEALPNFEMSEPTRPAKAVKAKKGRKKCACCN